MRFRRLVFLLSAILPSFIFAASKAEVTALRGAFALVRQSAVWPVPAVDHNNISSTFGPRLKEPALNYDWHRGIDIDAPLGTPVVAAYPGILWDITDFVDGGTTVVLRHDLPAALSYEKRTIQYFYTFYMHLDSVDPLLVDAFANNQKIPVAAGDSVGQVGHSGTTPTDHLHFELRVGSWCSLEFQLQNPSSSCSGFGFDPHMHPFFLLPQSPPAMALTVTQQPAAGVDGIVQFNCSRLEPVLNRVILKIYDNQLHRSAGKYILDLNERRGFDASTNVALDTVDPAKPYFSPVPFGILATIYETQIIIPAAYLGSLVGNRYTYTLKVNDIWGGKKKARF